MQYCTGSNSWHSVIDNVCIYMYVLVYTRNLLTIGMYVVEMEMSVVNITCTIHVASPKCMYIYYSLYMYFTTTVSSLPSKQGVSGLVS